MNCLCSYILTESSCEMPLSQLLLKKVLHGKTTNCAISYNRRAEPIRQTTIGASRCRALLSTYNYKAATTAVLERQPISLLPAGAALIHRKQGSLPGLNNANELLSCSFKSLIRGQHTTTRGLLIGLYNNVYLSTTCLQDLR